MVAQHRQDGDGGLEGCAQLISDVTHCVEDHWKVWRRVIRVRSVVSEMQRMQRVILNVTLFFINMITASC